MGRFSFEPKLARFVWIGIESKPDCGIGAFFDRKGSIRTSHVGTYPAGTHAVHGDAVLSQGDGLLHGEGVQGGLGNRVSRRPLEHIFQLSGTATDVDYSAGGRGFEGGEQGLAYREYAQRVDLERLSKNVYVERLDRFVAVQNDTGIVDEDVETTEFLLHFRRAKSDRLRVRHFELDPEFPFVGWQGIDIAIGT